MLRIALPVWNDRVSPVFDATKRVRVADIIDGSIVNQSEHGLEKGEHVTTLCSLGVDVLVCAGISPILETSLRNGGVEVVADRCGATDRIVEAYASGDKALRQFRSPGVSEHRHNRRT